MNLKKILVFAALFCTIRVTAAADTIPQRPSPINHFYMATTIAGLNTPMILRKNLYNDSSGHEGVARSSIQFGYQRNIGSKHKWTMGLDLSFTGYRTGNYSSGNGYYYYNVNVTNFITNVNWHWKTYEHSSLYSGIGFGVRINNMRGYTYGSTAKLEDISLPSLTPTFNYTLLGSQFTVGSKHRFGLKSEFGFGTNGLIRIGLLYRFK